MNLDENVVVEKAQVKLEEQRLDTADKGKFKHQRITKIQFLVNHIFQRAQWITEE